MASKFKKQVELFEAVANSIKKIGVDSTINAVKRAQNDFNNTEIRTLDIIINNACSIYKISKSELYSGNSRGIRPYAIGACSYMIKKHLCWSDTRISVHFDMDPANIFRNIKKTENMDPKIKEHANMIDNLMRLEEQIRIELED